MIPAEEREKKRKELIYKSPFLELRLVEGNGFSKQEVIKINAMGMIDSKRENSDDHYVYFGSAQTMNGKIVNDVVCAKED